LKLLTKTTLFFITIALFTLFLGGIGFYVSFKYMVNRQTKRELINEMHQFLLHPPADRRIGRDTVHYNLLGNLQITPIDKVREPAFVFSDTLLYDNIMKYFQAYRIIHLETRMNGRPVRISISKSMMISNQLVAYVAIVTTVLSLFLLVCILVFNNFFLSKIWGNFFATLNMMKDYKITHKKEIVFAESDIAEFNLLNDVFRKMHGRIRKDFENLKEFIENISHEIQTPLAIIRSKVDLLMQDEKLGKKQVNLVQSIQNNIGRLSNLNKSLILLSRIDNNQFPEKETVDVAENINFHLENMAELIDTRNITLQRDFHNPLTVRADPSLINIMILNLLKNAIFHNLHNGNVSVAIIEKTLEIRNTGKKLEIDAEDLFVRFAKSSEKSDSLGLGLSIVKKICDYYQFTLQYRNIGEYHIITIGF
jgi:signal transduction histidine kinase